MAKFNQDFAGQKNIPAGVKVISVLFYIGSVLFLISGILSIAGIGLPEEVGVPQLGRGFEIFGGVVSIILAVLVFLVGMGLWRGKRWTWITAIVLSVIGIITSLIGMVGGSVLGNLIGLIIYVAIGAYLLFNKDAKSVFS
ncbi:hypothetical protein HYV49_01300 [Candidatus Pacearchaeota archaeon]|nr:hypothetical protein [Candidatus Pacearchaeota archaeon]